MNNKKNSIITIIIGLLFAGIFTFVYINSEKKFKSFDKTTEATKIEENCEGDFYG